jgi:tetratricopeptide (TPR) repeat protein
MAALHTALEDARAGHGQLVLIAGEPGIGKTYLLKEFAHLARQRQAHVLWGRCWEGDGAPAFWPWVQIVRAYVQDCPPELLLAEMAAGAADIAQVVAEVRERVPDLPVAPRVDPESARFRFFDSVTTFLQHASRRQPLVLLLDDLHWADISSLRLLHFLARALRDARLLVVGSYRDVDVSRGHPLASILGELARETHYFPLTGLTVAEVAHCIAQASGAIPAASLVAALHEQTAGNPFFVREIVRLLAAEGSLHHADGGTTWHGTMPQSVRETLRRRLIRLSGGCMRLLTIAAVIGQEFSLPLLVRVIGEGADPEPTGVLECVQEALAARVLTEMPGNPGRYRFIHALMRETLYEESALTERIRLHRLVGETIEGLQTAYLEPYLAALADHFFKAAPGGERGKAMQYAIRAGQRALRLLAYEDAVAHYERALQLDELQAPHDTRRCELLLALGKALWGAGENPRAREVFMQAAQVAEALGAAELLAQAALGFGNVQMERSEVDDVLVGLLEAALAALGDSVSTLRVRVLARLTAALYFSPDEARRHALSAQALALAQQVGEPTARAAALSARHYALWGSGEVEERLALVTEVIRLAEAAGNRRMVLEGQMWKIVCLFECGDIDAVDREIESYARQEATLRLPRWRWHLFLMRAARALLAGQFDAGERLATEAFAVVREVGERTNVSQSFSIQMAMLRQEQGRLAEMTPAIMSNATRFASMPVWRCGLAALHSELGNRETAQREFEHWAARDFVDLPRNADWLPALALLTRVCCALRDRQRAATLYALLRPYEARNVVLGPAAVVYGSVAHYLGLLATLLSRWHDAEQHFTAALAMYTRMQAHPFVAHTQHDYARLLLARGNPGDGERALTLLDQAYHRACTLGMTRLCSQVEALQEQVAQDMAQRAVAAPATVQEAVFHQAGKDWTLCFAGQTIHQRDVKGLHYLVYLLQHPGQPVHVLDLLALTDTSPETRGTSALASLSADELTIQHLSVSGLPNGRPLPDAQARAAYRQRLRALHADLCAAERDHDSTRIATTRAEIDVITDTLAAVYGTRKHTRSSEDATEKARKAVTNRIRGVLAKLQPVHPTLWQHLFNSLKTGTFCTYRPAHLPVWTF